MRKLVLASVIVGGVVLMGASTHAQAPNPAVPPATVPEQMPFDIPYRPAIDLDHAKQVAAAAEAEAKKHNWKLNIAVVDPNGDLVYFERMTGAQVASVTISQGKARTAARYRRSTRAFFAAMETGHPYIATLDPTLIASSGGLPLVQGGKLIGAIGCSGGTGDQDEAACKAGADLVK